MLFLGGGGGVIEAHFLISFSPPLDIVNKLLHILQNALQLSSGTYFNPTYLTNHSI
jgi:hypothetical protein